MNRLILKIVPLLLAASPAVVLADPAPQYTPDQFVSAILAGPMPCPAGSSEAACEANPKTRRWSLEAPSRPSEASAQVPLKASPVRAGYARGAGGRQHLAQAADTAAAECRKVTAQDVCITFAMNSDEITPTGQANLRSVAAGLNTDSLGSIRFEVAGYTDATGVPAHNLQLSQRRAAAVKTFLVQMGVAQTRLAVTGFGSEHLAVPDNPGSAENRRVELHRLN